MNQINELMKNCAPVEVKLLSVKELAEEYCGKAKLVWMEKTFNNVCVPDVMQPYFVADVDGRMKNDYEGAEGEDADNYILLCPVNVVYANEKKHYKNLQKIPIDGYNTRPFGVRCWSAMPTKKQRESEQWNFSVNYSPEMQKYMYEIYSGPVRYFFSPQEGEEYDCSCCEEHSCMWEEDDEVELECEDCEYITALVVSSNNPENFQVRLFEYYDDAYDSMLAEYNAKCNSLRSKGYTIDDRLCQISDFDASVAFDDDNDESMSWDIIDNISCCANDINPECCIDSYACESSNIFAVVSYEDGEIACITMFCSLEDAKRFISNEYNRIRKNALNDVRPFSECHADTENKKSHSYIGIAQDGRMAIVRNEEKGMNYAWILAKTTWGYAPEL